MNGIVTAVRAKPEENRLCFMQGVFFRFFYAMKKCLRINHAFALAVIFHDIQLHSFYIKGPYV